MGKQKYTAKEKKVSRMTRNGLVEENLATKETRKVTNSDQELPYKQNRHLLLLKRRKTLIKKLKRNNFPKKFRREILPKKKRLQTVLRENEKHRDGTDIGTSLQVYLWIQR